MIDMKLSIYSVFTSSAGFFNQYVIPIGLDGIGWRYVSPSLSTYFISTESVLTTRLDRFYIVGVCWNVFMATVIGFTYLETKGLTLEQIDQRFNGVPRDQLGDILDIHAGEKPISEAEMGKRAAVNEVSMDAPVTEKK
jgi:hypothetical protein